MYNKESILLQINEAESQIKRLKTLVQTDLMIGEENIKVGLYCCEKAKLQLRNIQDEIAPMFNDIAITKEKLHSLRQQYIKPEEYRKLMEGDFKNEPE
jgi:hypothetical protein